MQHSAATVAWMTATFFLTLLSFQNPLSAQIITSITVSPDNNQAGVSTLYDVTFTPSFSVLSTDTLIFTFPPGFDVSGVIVASPVSGMDGGLTTTISGQNVLLGRDATGSISPPSLPVTVRFGTLTNTTVSGSSSTIDMTIRAFGGSDRETGTSATFSISAGALDHFAVTATDDGNIGDQVAGTAFNIKIAAQDVHNNTVTSFTGTVTLSEPTGTISPVTSNNFTAGILASQSVTMIKAQTTLAITATGSGKTGSSNTFNVNPGALAKFLISTITSPKTAGTSFSITMTAQDANDNTVTNFNGKADLSISLGTITPDSTDNFTNGVVTLPVTATIAQNDASITVQNGGASGISNAFNIIHGALSQFAISPIATPQTAGAPFEITMTAQDANQNTVTSFSGTVSITPNAGTITPTTSGSFINGVRTQQMTVPGIHTGLTLTVDNGGAQGTSNAFDVNPGALAKFLVTADDGGNIGAQTAGTPFNIKIVAQDANGNTVTSFSDVVSISDLSGTITPTTSNGFVNGELASEQVSVNQQQTNDVITVANGGITGSSNAFNVSQGSLHHVLVRTAANGGGIELGTFSMTADDELTVFAAGYDIGNSFISDVVVNWTLSGGLSGNPPSDTGTSFTFRPTTASTDGTVGQILANHATAIDDATGDITVTPGFPANALTLTPNPNTLPADGASVSAVTSSTVMDADGNAVGGGHEFTIQAFPGTAGSIPPTQDTNPALNGVQVKTDASSQLSFSFQAGTTGGIAQITASSLNGVSFGQTTVSVSSMDLLSIGSPKQVSRGQAKAQVTMAVQNRGSSPVIITSTGLNFIGTGGANRNADYPIVARKDTFTVIPAGLTRTLLFDVTVSATATVDTITISGTINGTINGTPVSDSVAEIISGWRVKLAAGALADVVTAPATVAQGQAGISVSVTVQNRLGFNDVADLLVDDVDLIFKKGATDVSSQYIVTPVGSNPDTIPGGSSQAFNFIVDVGATATIGQITVDALVTGRDINSQSTVSDVGASTPASWQVTVGASLQIVAMNTPESVTAGLQGPWQVQMMLQNNSNFQIDIDINSADTYIRFFSGVVNVTSEYTITKASVLQNSGTTILQPLSTDILVFTITQTGTMTGDINITGSVVGTDIGPNLPISDTTEDFGQGLVKVQTPAVLTINSIDLSQNTITQGQTTDWMVWVNVENKGGSDVFVDFNNSKPEIFFQNTEGYTIAGPAQFISGSDTLKANSMDTLVFKIDRSGTELGANVIDARVIGTEINRNLAIQDSTTATNGNQAIVTVQSPALFFIDSTYVSSPNMPFVNKSDTFKVKVRFKNDGQENVENMAVGLSSNGNSQIGPPSQVVIPLLGGDTTATAEFSVVADVVEAIELFTASFISAKSKNTGSFLNPDTAIDDTALAHIQAPAALHIVDVAPSSAAVSANQSNPPWFIYITVRDTGRAPIQFDPPRTDDISFAVNGVPAQPGDFVVQAPTALKNSGTLRLAGGVTDTLVYTVTRTGPTGGTATITAGISGKDANNNRAIQQTDTGTVEITTSATIGITGTTAQINNINNQGIGFVNISQIYTIRVRVRNTGVEPVKDIAVVLSTNGSSTITQKSKTIPLIGIGGETSLTFDITAPGSPNENGEVFTARIDSAFSVNSGKKANILAPSDPMERVVTQIPASISINAGTNPADGKLSLNQEFKVTATVKNTPGAAGIDNSGQVTITQIPPGYTRKNPGLEPLTRAFRLDSTVSWTFLAPNEKSASANFVIAITRSPLDLNSGQQASIANSLESASVETDDVSLRVSSIKVVSPEGAIDRIVSTLQIFSVQADILHSANLSEVKATIALPPGYSFRFANEIIKNVVSGSVSWDIQAPNSQTGTDDLFSIRGFGQTAEQTVVEDTETMTVTTVSQASVQFAAQITDPPGASSGSLARGQDFTLTASLTNLGRATTVGAGEVVLDLGETQVTTDSALTRAIRVGTPVVWTLKAPNNSVPLKPMTVRLTKTPADENTGSDAAIFDGIRTKEINVQTRALGRLTAGQLTITSPTGAQDSVLSTDQEFTMQATVSWQNAADVQAEIQFPPNSGYTVDNVNQPAENLSTTGNETFQWQVTAPSQPRMLDNLQARFTARDASHTTQLSTTTAFLPVQVVQKAKVFLTAEISAPPSAIDKKVSPDQVFTVRATITNVGEANTLGRSRIQINLPLDYTTTDTTIKRTSRGIAEWQVLSPAAPHEDIRNIDIIVIDTPRDANTGKKLELDITKESIGITTETSKLTVRQLEIPRSSAVVNGQQNVEMFRFKAENIGEIGASNILLNGINIEFVDNQGNPIEANKVITAISVKSISKPDHFFRSTTGLNSSRIQLNFTTPDTLLPLKPDSVMIFVDVANSEAAKSFSLHLKSTDDIDAIDQESRKFVLVELLNLLNQVVQELQSKSAVLISNNFETSFRNGPNPFSPIKDFFTSFEYVLQQNSEVELHIYTLFGELVRLMKFSPLDSEGLANGQAKRILWDGRNGKGKIVVNGVYLAVLKTNAGMATTKVAVVK
jgi:hypothetical protein